jgi:hypothetical protein
MLLNSRRWLGPLSVLVLASCDIAPERGGSCQLPVELAVGTFERAESFYDDCQGPDTKGDIFTMSLASPAGLFLEVTPEGNFAPTLYIYRGQPDDVDPAVVAQLNGPSGSNLAVRVFLGAGDYFMVVGTRIARRRYYRVSAVPTVSADCNFWNFATKGIELNGNVTTADCPEFQETMRREYFEIWLNAGDSVNVTIVADSGGSFAFGEGCCEFEGVFAQLIAPGDSFTFGHRVPRSRPYRSEFARDVPIYGPATYRLRID